MLSDLPSTLVALKSALRVLTALEDDEAQSIVPQVIAADLTRQIQCVVVPASPRYPAFAIADDPQASYIVCGGCSALTHGVLTVSGYIGTEPENPTDPSNTYFWDVADTIWQTCLTTGLGQKQQRYYFGHSLGGAALTLAAGGWADPPLNHVVSLLTVGAPKPSSAGQAGTLARVSVGRWFRDDDPVPLVMPAATDAPALALLYPVPALIRFQNFVQPAGGLQIQANGTVTRGTLPATAALAPIPSLAGWLYALDSYQPGPHSLSSYMVACDAALQASVSGGRSPNTGGPAERPYGTSRAPLSAAARAAETALAEQEAGQHVNPWKIPDDYWPRPKKLGGVYAVVAGNVVLTVSSRRRSAIAIAKRFRSLVRELQLAGMVNADATAAWLSDLMTDGTAAGGSFVPTLKTSLDVAPTAVG